ncbi:MAG: MATE family efflux transporter, partial [Saprospiraceae bacterium]|nr:MATE family efflux transporter [Saprospiraceae bacterium]
MNQTISIIRDALQGKEVDLTAVSIKRAIVLLAIPMVLEMIMESLFAVVDVFFVSQVSTEAIATVGLTESVLTLLYACAMGLSMGATAMVSRRVGEKNPDAAGLAAAQAIMLGLILSVIVGVVGIFYAEDILRLMGGSPSLVESGKGYTRLMLGTSIIIILLFLLNGIFRGAGNAALAMQALWIANGINIILDPLLIFGWGPIPAMGVEGAALATVIGRSTGVLFQLYLLFRGKGIVQIRAGYFRVRAEVMKRLLGVAATGAGQFLISSASW